MSVFIEIKQRPARCLDCIACDTAAGVCRAAERVIPDGDAIMDGCPIREGKAKKEAQG